MVETLSIAHSSKVAILCNDPTIATNSSSSMSGIAAVLVSPSLLKNLNDNGGSGSFNIEDSERTEQVNESTYSIEEQVLKIQISMTHNDSYQTQSTSGAATSSSYSIVTYETRFSVKDVISNLIVTINDKDSASPYQIQLKKLKHMLSLLKYTTSVPSLPAVLGNESSTSTLPSQHFIVIELTQQNSNEKIKSLLKLSIKERMPNTMVRIVWSTMLSCVDDHNVDDAKMESNEKNNSASALLELSIRLTEQQQEIVQQLLKVQEEYQLLQRNRDGWKDTAQKLEGQWENEKSILFRNFCALYTSKQDHDQAIISQLQIEVDQFKVQVTKGNDSVPGLKTDQTTTTKTELPECLQDVPDDNQFTFNDDVVRRLARGERVPMKAIKTEDHVVPDNPKSNVHRKRHLDLMSFATEYMDADDALHDIFEPSDVPSRPIPTRKPRTDSKPAAVKEEKKQQKKKIQPPPKVDDNSETGSDDDFVDKSMEAQIMADLQALRK